MRLDVAAPVADSCASLWACSSPRSRCRAQPAPWLRCCRACCVKHWTSAGSVTGAPWSKVNFTRDADPYKCSRGISTLSRAPTFSTEWTPPQPASPVCRLAGSGSDLSVAYVSWMEGGPKLKKQTSLPHVECFTRGEESGAKRSYLRTVWVKAQSPPPPFFWRTYSWDTQTRLFYTICWERYWDILEIVKMQYKCLHKSYNEKRKQKKQLCWFKMFPEPEF